MTGDILTNYVVESHAENGPRSELKMRKERGGAGFCIKAKGGRKAIAKLEKLLGDIDLAGEQE